MIHELARIVWFPGYPTRLLLRGFHENSKWVRKGELLISLIFKWYNLRSEYTSEDSDYKRSTSRPRLTCGVDKNANAYYSEYHTCIQPPVFTVLLSIPTKVSVIDGSSPFASAYNLVNIIKAYQERNREFPLAV